MAESIDLEKAARESEQSLLNREPWRYAGVVERQEYADWAAKIIPMRTSMGMAKYGQVFQGVPTEQGIEECLDQLFYLYWAKRHIAWLEGQRNIFRGLLEEIMETDKTADQVIRERIFIALR